MMLSLLSSSLVGFLVLSTSVQRAAAAACAQQWVTGAPGTILPSAIVSNGGHNYQCTSGGHSLHCPGAGYEPGVGAALNWQLPWTDLGACSGSVAPPTPPTPVPPPPTPVTPTPAVPATPPTPIVSAGVCAQQWVTGTPGTYLPSVIVSNGGHNYQCTSGGHSLHCSGSAYEPGVGAAQNWKLPWTLLGTCSGSPAPPTPPTPTPLVPASSPVTSPTPLVSAGGCYAAWVEGGTYTSGSLVTNDGRNYQCSAGGYEAFCPMIGYKPGVGLAQHWQLAWTLLGSCSGTATTPPTTSPTSRPTLPSVGACPVGFSASASYVALDLVEVSNVVYRCKAGNFAAFCPLTGYEPGSGVGFASAWDILGSCSGVGTPASPTPVSSPSGAPACTAVQWVPGTSGDYVGGDLVSNGGRSYQCTNSGFYLFCSQSAYEPGVGIAANWKLAWTDLGACSGAPPAPSPSTPAASTPSLPCVGPAYAANGVYVAGSITSRSGREYMCTSSGYALYCPLAAFQPGDDPSGTGWSPWNDLGACGSVAGVPAPTPVAPSAIGGGCPNSFSTSATYSAGDQVAVSNIAYQCKSSNWQFCDTLGYEPGTGIAYTYAWEALGVCTGSMPPTGSPTGRPTNSPTSKPTFPSAGVCPTGSYSYPNTFTQGSEIKKDNVAYRCTSLLCQVAGFEPGVGIYWQNAWTLLGSCT